MWNSSGSKTRRDGMRVLSVDGIQLCQFFMRNGVCPQEANGIACQRLHRAKQDRPPCPNFSKCGVCKFATECWYPHIQLPQTCEPNVGVQVHGTHLQRLEEYFRSLQACSVVATAASAAGRKCAKMLLLHVQGDVPQFVAALINNCRLRAAVASVYPISISASAAGLESAVQRALQQEADAATKVFRLHTFPRSLAHTLGEDVVARACSSQGIELDCKKASHLLSIVLAADVYYVGTAARERYTVSWDPNRAGGARGAEHTEGAVEGGCGHSGNSGREGGGRCEAVCKAYYKLKEALEVAGSSARVPGGGAGAWRALDIGASPGGWTQCLLEAGASHVIAVDPGNVLVEPRSLMSKVEHLRAKVQDSIAGLVARGEVLDMAVCDMNCSPRECVEAVLSARMILKASALLVITFKKFSESGKCTHASYKADQEDAVEALRAVCATLELVHLFANTIEERTIIATLN